jgi:hypothetical protein
MKLFLKSFFAFFAFTLFLSSCTDDGGGIINPVVTNPKVDFTAGTGLLTADATVNVGEVFSVNLVGSKGTNPMKTITFNEAGNKIDLARLTFSTGGSANPLLLSGTSTSSFDIKVSIKAHTDVSAKAYSFVITDDAGYSTTKTITITTKGTPPTINEPTGDQKVEIKPDAYFSTLFKVVKGTSQIQTIEVLINDVRAKDTARIFYQNLQTPFLANPYNVPTADKDNLNREILFRAPSTPGVYKYTVKFIDATGLSVSRNITATVGTAVTVLEGILLNQSGPSGQGGLDLDTGASTGTVSSDPSSAKADIRDEGIVNLTNDPTWKQQISGINGSIVKYLIKGKNGLSETFKFDDVTYKEQIPALYLNSQAFTAKSSDNRDISNKVAVGDIFIVKNADKYYVITVKSIKVTTDDNKDSYTFDVRF